MAEREVVVNLKLGDTQAVERLGRLEIAIKADQRALRELNTTIREQGFATKEQAVKVGEFNAKIRQQQGLVRELKNDLSGLTDAGLRFRDKMADAAKAGLGAFGLNIIGVTAAVTGLVNVMRSSTKTIANFEQANANLASILGKSRKEIGALTESAIKLGPALGRLPEEVTQLQTELAKLGFTEQQIIDAQEAVVQLANATGESLPRSAEVAASTIKGFNLTAEDSQRVVDVMAESFNRTALDLEKFATSMSVLGPVAETVGVSLEGATAIVGLLADRGVDASTIGTSMRDIFIDIAAKGLTLEEALSRVNGSTDKLSTATELFGKRSATTALILADNVGQLSELAQAYGDAGGAAEKMADEQLDTLTGAAKRLTATWDAFILSIEKGDGVLGRFIRGTLDTFTNFLDFFTTDEIEKNVEGFGKRVSELMGKEFSGVKDIDEAGFFHVNAIIERANGDLEELAGARELLMERIQLAGGERPDVRGFKLTPQVAALKAEIQVIDETIGALKNKEGVEKKVSDTTDSVTIPGITKDTEARRENVKFIDDQLAALIRQNEERLKLLAQPEDTTPLDPINNTLTPFATDEASEGSYASAIERKMDLDAMETAAFIELQNAKFEAIQGFSTLLGKVAEDNVELQKTFIAIEKTVAIAQVIFNLQKEIAGISAANSSLGVLGVPITTAQIAAAKVRAATGIAAIISAAASSLSGFESGGYTPRRGSDSAPVGVVHANEWVASAPLVREWRPLFDWLDQYQRTGRAPMLGDGFQTGGFVPQPSPQQLVQVEQIAETRAIEFSPVVRVTDINDVQDRVAVIDNLTSA